MSTYQCPICGYMLEKTNPDASEASDAYAMCPQCGCPVERFELVGLPQPDLSQPDSPRLDLSQPDSPGPDLSQPDSPGPEALEPDPRQADPHTSSTPCPYPARRISDDLWWVGAYDVTQELFENCYPLDHGATYNSYLLLDEKTVLVDTVDASVIDIYLDHVAAVLAGRTLDYLIVDHVEPDHSAAIAHVLERYPSATLLTNALAKTMIEQFFDCDLSARTKIVAEGDVLDAGRHTLRFIKASMVHWPEVMMTYDVHDKVLFSADAFGTFGAIDTCLYADELDIEREWLPEARRYYCNIVGKYGSHVQAVLDKASKLDIAMICSTHGPIWRRDLAWLLNTYATWASYEPEERAVVVFCASIYGHTARAAEFLVDKIREAGVTKVSLCDVTKLHVSELLSEAFRASHLVFAGITYNMGIFTPMKTLLDELSAHNFKNRCVSFVGNGTWAPVSAKLMSEATDAMSGMELVGEPVTFRSAPNESTFEELTRLAQAIATSVSK